MTNRRGWWPKALAVLMVMGLCLVAGAASRRQCRVRGPGTGRLGAGCTGSGLP
ncbi:hypothetical protein [Candidatus Desulforudis audaxviator]|uniref:hypothetical protein n=1 Tax=Candidatus Desulforudis audaxviator TaxID=471827 RepID=UPI00140F92DC|nr:hypothetical protein [Candidatus Desulforudis audaxviator]